jgi:hypothetical protein
MLIDEKKKYCALEKKLRHVVSKQWEHLHRSVKSMSVKSIHPEFWGHKTQTLRRSRNHVGSSPPLPSQPPNPVPLPPRVEKHDEYTNKSTILACQEDGDWQVAQSEEDASSEISTIEVAVYEEIIAEVHAPAPEHICQGTTDSPTKGIEGLIYGDDITPVPPVDRQVEITAPNGDVDRDEAICPEVRQAMTAHPPPFSSITEAREVLGAKAGDEWLAHSLHQVEYDFDEDAYCSQLDDHDDDVPRRDDDDNNIHREDCSQSNASVQDPYLAEFSQYYANYEEGADYLYYRDEDDDANVFEDDEEDNALCHSTVQDPGLTEFQAFYATYEEGADHLYYKDDEEGVDHLYYKDEEEDADETVGD